MLVSVFSNALFHGPVDTTKPQHSGNKNIHVPAAIPDAPKPAPGAAPKAGAADDAPKAGAADAPKPVAADAPKAGAADAPKPVVAPVAPKAGALVVEPKPLLLNVAGAVPVAKPLPLFAPKGAGVLNPAHCKYVTPLVPRARRGAQGYAQSRFSGGCQSKTRPGFAAVAPKAVAPKPPVAAVVPAPKPAPNPVLNPKPAAVGPAALAAELAGKINRHLTSSRRACACCQAPGNAQERSVHGLDSVPVSVPAR